MEGPSLQYSPPPNVSKRRPLTRHLLLGGIFLVVVALYFRGEEIWRQAQLVYYQHQCQNHLQAADQAVYEERPDGARRLVDRLQYLSSPAGAAYYFDPDWADFNALLAPPGVAPNPTLYLHQRQTPDGRNRLVAVELLTVRSIGAARALDFSVRVIEPGYLSPPKDLSAGSGLVLGRVIVSSQSALRLFAGQNDPDNPSHFIIEYQEDDSRHRTIDGWLRDDDTVALEPRDTPSTLP
ncbi:MAG: hypothetical protein IT446_15380 [Phycisphaerales bacterium]|nr:hypothetical protein [Phycisphaerales bacterium]